MLTLACWVLEAVSRWVASSTPEAQTWSRIAADAAKADGWLIDAVTLWCVGTNVIACVVVFARRRWMKAKGESQ